MEGSHPGTRTPHALSDQCPKRHQAATHKDGWVSPEGLQGWDQRQNRRTFSAPMNSASMLPVGSRARCFHPDRNCKHRSCKLPTRQGECQHRQPTPADAAMGTQHPLLYGNVWAEAFFQVSVPKHRCWVTKPLPKPTPWTAEGRLCKWFGPG